MGRREGEWRGGKVSGREVEWRGGKVSGREGEDGWKGRAEGAVWKRESREGRKLMITYFISSYNGVQYVAIVRRHGTYFMQHVVCGQSVIM